MESAPLMVSRNGSQGVKRKADADPVDDDLAAAPYSLDSNVAGFMQQQQQPQNLTDIYAMMANANSSAADCYGVDAATAAAMAQAAPFLDYGDFALTADMFGLSMPGIDLSSNMSSNHFLTNPMLVGGGGLADAMPACLPLGLTADPSSSADVDLNMLLPMGGYPFALPMVDLMPLHQNASTSNDYHNIDATTDAYDNLMPMELPMTTPSPPPAQATSSSSSPLAGPCVSAPFPQSTPMPIVHNNNSSSSNNASPMYESAAMPRSSPEPVQLQQQNQQLPMHYTQQQQQTPQQTQLQFSHAPAQPQQANASHPGHAGHMAPEPLHAAPAPAEVFHHGQQHHEQQGQPQYAGAPAPHYQTSPQQQQQQVQQQHHHQQMTQHQVQQQQQQFVPQYQQLQQQQPQQQVYQHHQVHQGTQQQQHQLQQPRQQKPRQLKAIQPQPPQHQQQQQYQQQPQQQYQQQPQQQYQQQPQQQYQQQPQQQYQQQPQQQYQQQPQQQQPQQHHQYLQPHPSAAPQQMPALQQMPAPVYSPNNTPPSSPHPVGPMVPQQTQSYLRPLQPHRAPDQHYTHAPLPPPPPPQQKQQKQPTARPSKARRTSHASSPNQSPVSSSQASQPPRVQFAPQSSQQQTQQAQQAQKSREMPPPPPPAAARAISDAAAMPPPPRPRVVAPSPSPSPSPPPPEPAPSATKLRAAMPCLYSTSETSTPVSSPARDLPHKVVEVPPPPLPLSQLVMNEEGFVRVPYGSVPRVRRGPPDPDRPTTEEMIAIQAKTQYPMSARDQALFRLYNDENISVDDVAGEEPNTIRQYQRRLGNLEDFCRMRILSQRLAADVLKARKARREALEREQAFR